MADLTSLLTSGALAIGQNIFQKNAPQGLQNLVGTGADIYNNQQLRDAEQDRISQINKGFNQARGDITTFGNRALDAATAGTDVANKSIRDATGRAVGAQQPFYDSGLSALSEFQSILQNPDQILSEPGVQFQYEQGLEAVNRMAEKNNLLGSSARLNAATEFGQGLASTSMDQALNRRLPLIQGGQNAANVMSQANITEGTNLANVNTQQGRTLADINLSMGENLADLSLGQNALLSNRDLADAVSQTGLLDILTGGSAGGGAGGIPAEAGEPGFIQGLSDSVKSLFGGGEGAGIAGATALGINTAPALLAGGAGTEVIGSTLGFGAGATGTLAGAATPGVGASQLGLASGAGTSLTATGQGASAFGAPAGFGSTAGGGAEAGSTLAARGTPVSPATAAAWAGPITAGVALLRGEGLGQAASQGLGAAGGAALGAQLGSAGGPMGAIAGAMLGGFMGGIGGGSIGKALGISASGGGDDKPDYSLTYGANNTGLMARSPWGVFGFGHHKHLTNNSRYQAGLNVVAEADKIVDSQLTPDESAAVKQAFNEKKKLTSNSNEGGFNPGRMMSHFFKDRANVLQQTLGPERFAQLKLDEIYTAFSSGDQQQIEAAFT